MAALVEGRQYGLSSKGHLNENKTRILVKFTDSALRAVDEHLNSRSGSGKFPTIQFNGNQGCIAFPSLQSSNGEHSFKFRISSTSDIEGPQGSFECIQQTGSRSLESLGSLQYKMHIEANDDVYAVTRQKMAVAEEESKKNCTKIIKHTDSYVGRKVKKHTVTSKPLMPYSNSNNHLKNNGSIYNNKPNGANGYHNNNVNFNKNLPNTKPGGMSEIQKRPFRDRVVHILALRPFKMPDLLARLMKDGLGDKDRQCLNSILSKVAVLKDSTYTFAKHTWSEIQDDWPFYTEFERQLLKRNRTQKVNVLPSSQISGSDSPLNSQNGNSPTSLQKRQIVVEEEPPAAKRQRISHFNHNSSNGKQENNEGHGPNSREVLQNNYRPEVNHVNGYSRTISESSRNGSSNKSGTNGYHNVNKIDQHSLDIFGEKGETNGHPDSFSQKTESNGWNSSNNHHSNSQNASNHISNGMNNNTIRNTNLSPTLSTLPHMTPLPSPDGQDSLELRGFLNETSNGCVVDVSSYSDNYSDYLKKYTEILNPEQRARYKSDFNAEYLLYLDVHAIVDQVSKRFTILKENLRKVGEGSEDWQRVKDQILREYGEMKRDSKYQDARQKFQIMHEKLSHIKRLIFEYDQLNGVHS